MRIRSIKPDFWRSEDIKRLPREVRLLFIGLWSYVDDNGVGVDDYRQIAADLGPIEDDPVEFREYVREGLATLSRQSSDISSTPLVARYEVSGKRFLYITGWEHQRVDKPGKPRYPLPPKGWLTSADDPSRDTLATLSRETPSSFDTGRNRTPPLGVDSPTVDSCVDSHESPDDNPLTCDSGNPREDVATSSRLEQGNSRNRGTGEQGLTTTDLPDAPRRARSNRTPAKSIDPHFEAFWAHYPRKEAKASARKAWPAATRKLAPERLVNAARYWAGLWADAGTPAQFIPYPATWLNGERWDDAPPTPRDTPVNGHAAKPSTTDARVAAVLALRKPPATPPTAALELEGTHP